MATVLKPEGCSVNYRSIFFHGWSREIARRVLATEVTSDLDTTCESFKPMVMEVNAAADTMDLDDVEANPSHPQSSPQQPGRSIPGVSVEIDNTHAVRSHPRENFRDIHVKVHIRQPDRDSWVYLGRGLVSHELTAHSSRVVLRSASSGKVLALFSEWSEVQAEKRGNFVVVGCVEASHVISWSLNAMNNAETLRLLASIELACYRCKQAVTDPRLHTKVRRRIDRIIREDRRKRHRRRKDQDSMIDAFSRQNLGDVGAGPGPAPP